ncbi:hypothetical protein [Salinarimonas ramus]|uniref:Uncharacterized protein n=1 Tax=Salinarimonas ramus TaxID=690164 RepID=A0A917QF89_9HYPH|nr:hypothetical protein [Salinarimonas ramus]GGK47679.1 hypothetical protein GCM10011322_38400 [Salinarimonas ramus]
MPMENSYAESRHSRSEANASAALGRADVPTGDDRHPFVDGGGFQVPERYFAWNGEVWYETDEADPYAVEAAVGFFRVTFANGDEWASVLTEVPRRDVTIDVEEEAHDLIVAARRAMRCDHPEVVAVATSIAARVYAATGWRFFEVEEKSNKRAVVSEIDAADLYVELLEEFYEPYPILGVTVG